MLIRGGERASIFEKRATREEIARLYELSPDKQGHAIEKIFSLGKTLEELTEDICFQIFKWNESKKRGYDLKGEAKSLWMREGYHIIFSQFYNKDKSPEEIYDLITRENIPVRESTPA